MFNMDFLYRSSLRGTTLCVAPTKSYNFSTNYHACMAMPKWCRCAPPMLFRLWPLFSLFPRSCLTWIFLIDLHCEVLLRGMEVGGGVGVVFVIFSQWSIVIKLTIFNLKLNWPPCAQMMGHHVPRWWVTMCPDDGSPCAQMMGHLMRHHRQIMVQIVLLPILLL